MQERDRIALRCFQEGFRHPFRRAALERAEVGEDVAIIAALVERIDEAAQSHAGKDHPARVRAARQHPYRRPRTQRIAAQVIIGQAKLVDDRQIVLRQGIGRIGGGIMRFAAFAMPAQVRHDQPEASLHKPRGMAVTDPIGPGVREIAMDEDEVAPLPNDMNRNGKTAEPLNFHLL